MSAEMRRRERQTTEEKAFEILKNGEYGVLSTVGEDGLPYGVPLNYVLDGDKIYFHCAQNVGLKQKNIEFCPEVSFCTVINAKIVGEKLTSKYQSAVAFGTAHKADKNKNRALRLLVEKYAPEFLHKGEACIEKSGARTDVYEITVKKISGKENL